MNSATPARVLLLVLCALAMTSCAGQQKSASNQNLKLETIRRPMGPTTYLYRETNDPGPAQ